MCNIAFRKVTSQMHSQEVCGIHKLLYECTQVTKCRVLCCLAWSVTLTNTRSYCSKLHRLVRLVTVVASITPQNALQTRLVCEFTTITKMYVLWWYTSRVAHSLQEANSTHRIASTWKISSLLLAGSQYAYAINMANKAPFMSLMWRNQQLMDIHTVLSHKMASIKAWEWFIVGAVQMTTHNMYLTWQPQN